MPKQTTDIIWNWKAVRRSSGESHSGKRNRFWLQAAVMSVAGGFLFLSTVHRVLPCFLWTLTGLLLAGLLFSDRILRGFDRSGAWLARAVGGGLTWGLLTPFFFLVFGFGRLLLMITGRDPLQRKLDPHAPGYWSDHPGSEAPSRYQKQF